MRLLVVIDSNVFVSSLLTRGTCRAILDEWRTGAFDAATSLALLRELQGVLKRPKFRNRISPTDTAELLAFIEDTAIRIHPDPLTHRISRDKTDDHVFACALSAGAACIVSGDADVLTVAPIPGLRVLSPASFLDWLRSH